MKDEENKKQAPATGKHKEVNTPEPPQRKDPHNKSEANRDEEPSATSSKRTADRQAEPSAKKEQDPPTTTTNRNSY